MNLSTSTMNSILRENGSPRINPLTAPDNWSNLLPNLIRNAKEGAAGFSTMLGSIAAPFFQYNREANELYKQAYEEALKQQKQLTPSDWKSVQKDAKELRKQLRNDAFRKAVTDERFKRAGGGLLGGAVLGGVVGGAPGAIAGGLAGIPVGLLGPKGAADAFLSTYNTSIDRIKNKQTTWEDVVQGAFDNPLWAGLDVLSVGGADDIARGLTKAGNAVSNTRLGADLGFSKDARQFTRNISQTLNNARASQSPLYQSYNKLVDAFMPLDEADAIRRGYNPGFNKVELVKDIQTNISNLPEEGKAIANAIKADLNANSSAINSMGLLPAQESAVNQIAQYVMARQPEDSTILFKDVVDMIKGDKPQSPEVSGLIGEGYDSLRNLDTAWLTQALVPSVDPSGVVRARDFANPASGYFGTPRIIGRTKPEDLAKVLEDSIKYQLDQTTKLKEAESLLNQTINSSDTFKPLVEGQAVPSGYTTFDPNVYQQELRRQLLAGESVDVKKAINVANTKQAGAILMPKSYNRALQNAVTSSNKNWYRDITNMFKKSALATVHNIVANRIGNISNNAMAGVGLGDYVDAFIRRGEMPNQLRQQTSFNSYVNAGLEDSLDRNPLLSFQNSANNMRRIVDRYNLSDKGLPELGRFVIDTLGNINDAVADPFFRLESTMERMDRYANIMNKVKQIAEESNMPIEKVLKYVNSDDKLFNEINTLTNKELGDYVGRNYFLPNWYYDILGTTVPFYRFITQTGRTTFNQLKNNPLGFQLQMLPARTGGDVANEIRNNYNLDEKYYEGGAPYALLPNGELRTVGVEPLPFMAVASQFGGLLGGDDTESMVTPIPSAFLDVMRYTAGGGKRKATSEGMREAILKGEASKESYKPTMKERILYGINRFLNTTSVPYRALRGMGREAAGVIYDRPLHSFFDVNAFISNPQSYARELPEEKIGGWFTLRSNSNYRKSPMKNKKDRQQGVRERSYMLKNEAIHRPIPVIYGGVQYFD